MLEIHVNLKCLTEVSEMFVTYFLSFVRFSFPFFVYEEHICGLYPKKLLIG